MSKSANGKLPHNGTHHAKSTGLSGVVLKSPPRRVDDEEHSAYPIPSKGEGIVNVHLSQGIINSLRVFKSHFPKLLQEHPGKWAACDGEKLLFVGDSQEKIYKRCLKRGLKEDEFVVLCVLPDATEFID